MARLVICSECGEEKPLYAEGLCSTCYRRLWWEANPEKAAEYNHRARERYWADPEKAREEERQKYRANRDERRKQARQYYEKHGPRDRADYMYQRRYGITLAEYDAMLKAQGGVCAICGKTPEENGRRLCVDHCHDSEEVRGLLCDDCNRAIGLLQDDRALLWRALAYLAN